MQTLLRRCGTGRYLANDGTWTEQMSQARAFSNGLSARTYRALHKLSDTQLTPALHEPRSECGASSTFQSIIPDETNKSRGHIEAEVELGPGHDLFIRGHGAGLSWHKGAPLKRVDATKWAWTAEYLDERIMFGLLLDDQIWAKGEQLLLNPGERLELRPDFDWPEIPRIS